MVGDENGAVACVLWKFKPVVGCEGDEVASRERGDSNGELARCVSLGRCSCEEHEPASIK